MRSSRLLRYCLIVSLYFPIYICASTGEHTEFTFKSYLPILLLQASAFILLVWIVLKLSLPVIKKFVKEKKEGIQNILKSLDDLIVNYSQKMKELQEQIVNIKLIIENRKKEREKAIEKIAQNLMAEIELIKQKVSSRIKLEEELELLKLKKFLNDYVKSKIVEFVYSSTKDIDLMKVQKEYETEFLTKFDTLVSDRSFVEKLKGL